MTTQIPHVSNLPWLARRTILYGVHGSRAYGTNRVDSDYDYKGITIPPRAYLDGFLLKFEQAIIKDPDVVIYDVRKFFGLAADANPNILELLFLTPSDLLVCTEQGRLLLDHRVQFLSKKVVHTFRGYAVSQLHRIQSHKKWLLAPPDHQPTRVEFDLPERTVIPADQLAAAMSEVTKKLDSWEIDFLDMDEAGKIYIHEQITSYLKDLKIGSDEKFRAAGRLIGYEENFLVLLDRERHYSAALRNWQQYQDWKTNRNVKRSDLEAKFGYDTKHGMHLVRLLRMCREILTEGLVHVRRPDAKELLAIRDGEWSYEKLIGWAEEQDADLMEVAKTSPLPKGPDRVALDELCQEIVRSMPAE